MDAVASQEPILLHAMIEPSSATKSGSQTRRRANVSRARSTKDALGTSGASSKERPRRRRSDQRSVSLRRRAGQFATKHTWTIPFLLLALFGLIYAFNPSATNIIHPFVSLSYKLPRNDASAGAAQYGKGPLDLAFVAFFTIVLSFTREFITQELLRPLARYYGITSRGKQLRFMEQMYTAIYFGFAGPLGLYVMSRTPVWYFSTTGMYESYPHKTHEAVFKFYYLFQAAYWIQQAIVMALGIEKRRNDFKELVAHHIVTVSLIGLSYRFHFTYIGIAIYITHDISDMFLALSKSLHYVDSPITSVFFAMNIGTWVYYRHYLNLRVLYSLLTEFRTVGPYQLNWETEQYKCWISNVITFVLLALLQMLNLFWLYCLLRSAYKLVVYKIAKDDRSEGESDAEGA